MKCPNCGAELEEKREVKFCPYCGHKVEFAQKTPETISGAVYGIAKGVIDEVGKQLDYNREHAKEIEERKKKHEKENMKQGLCFLIVSIALFIGLMVFIEYKASEEKREKQANPTGVVYIQNEVA